MGENKYVFAVARIRVKEKSLLTDTDINTMAAMPDESSVISYLEDKGWGDANSGDDPEKILAAEMEKTQALMKELKIDSGVFDLLSYPRKFHNIKAGIKALCTDGEHTRAFYPDEEWPEERIMTVLKEKNFRELPEMLQAPAERALDVMLKTKDGQLCDVIIDRACLDAMEKAGRKSKSDLLRDYEESQVAITDIKIAVRAMRTGKNLSFLKEALAPCKTLDVRLLAIAASEGEESLLNFLEEHGMKEAKDALKESYTAFERWCDNRLIETIKPQKRNPFSMGPVIAYYLARENEIRCARIILTAKANDFPEQAIRERVRQMYG